MKNRLFITAICILAITFNLQAQDNLGKAKQILEWVLAGQGDSIYANMADHIRDKIKPEDAGIIIRQLEMQVGKYQSAGEWKTEAAEDNNHVYLTELQFETMSLIFRLVLDEEEKIAGLWFQPGKRVDTATNLTDNETYKEEKVEIVTGDYKLPGVLTLPKGVTNPPVAILVHGSGPNDRDDTVGPNKVFREIACGLAQRGIAVVRYDKRTFVYGGSWAPKGKESLDEETVNDALSAVKLVQNHELLAASRVYVIGHSQGAMAAPRIAERAQGLSGIIMIAGNARPLPDLLVEQYEYLLNFPSSGLTTQVVDDMRKRVDNLKRLDTPDFDPQIPFPFDQSTDAYWRSFNEYNQQEVASQLTLPIFVMQGERDYQVTMEDFALWQSALKANEKAFFKSYPELNHQLHPGTGKATPMEYAQKNEIPDYVLDDMSIWINLQSQTDIERAQQLFELVKAGKGDELYKRMNEEARTKISPEDLGRVFTQSERMYGKFQSQDEWVTDSIGKQTVYYSDIHFEKDGLRLMVAFDQQGKAISMLFFPVPDAIEVAPIVLNKRKAKEEEIEIVTGNYKLPGTLTLPTKVKNPPVVILVHGSGASDRNETMGPNATFRDLAWGLANRGIAVIRYDKRTLVYASSCTSDTTFTYDDETVDDALTAIRLAQSHKKLAKSDIYIIGHSLGAMLAPRIAGRDTSLSGIILLAGPARMMDEAVPEQMTYLSNFSGMSEAAQKEIEDMKLQFANARKLGTDAFDPTIALPFNLPASYLTFAYAYKPVEVARKLTLPILILQGERDYQVTMQDFGLWRMGLFRNKNVFFKSYPKLNHHFHEGSGKSMPAEYYKKNSVAAYVLDDIAGWIKTKKIEDK